MLELLVGHESRYSGSHRNVKFELINHLMHDPHITIQNQNSKPKIRLDSQHLSRHDIT